MSWTPQAAPWLLVAAALLVLAAIIFSRQRASRVAVLFCAMIVLVAVWFGAFALMFLAAGAGLALRFSRLGLAGVALLPAALYDFTATALRLYSKRRLVVHVVWVVAGMWAVTAAFTSGLASGVAKHEWGYYPTNGPLFPIFLLFFFAEGGEEEEEEDGEERTVRRVVAPFVLRDAAREAARERRSHRPHARDDPDDVHDEPPLGVEAEGGGGEIVERRRKERHAGEAETAEAEGEAGAGREEHEREGAEPDRDEDDHRAEEDGNARGALAAEDDRGQHEERGGDEQPGRSLGGPRHRWV